MYNKNMIISQENKKARILYLIATVIWAGLIFYLSSIPELSSGLETWQDLILRKLAHVAVYLVLAYLLAKSFNSVKRPLLLFVVIVCVAYAWIDEFHQIYVFGRMGAAQDVLIDTVGVFAGIWLYLKRQKNLFD